MGSNPEALAAIRDGVEISIHIPVWGATALVLFYITLSTSYTHPDGQMMITPVKIGRNSVGTAFWISPLMYASGYVNCGNGSLGGGNWGFRLFYQINGVAYDFPDYALTSIKYMLGW